MKQNVRIISYKNFKKILYKCHTTKMVAEYFKDIDTGSWSKLPHFKFKRDRNVLRVVVTFSFSQNSNVGAITMTMVTVMLKP